MLGESFVSKDTCLFESMHAFSDFNVHPTTVGCSNCMEIILLDNLVGDEAQWEARVFIVSYAWECSRTSLMPVTMNLPFGVKMVLLMRHLVVVNFAVGVLTMPGYSRRLPPMVSPVPWVLCFCRRIIETIWL
jgi:hypothetical protein